MVQINEIGALQNLNALNKTSTADKPKEANNSIFAGSAQAENQIVSEKEVKVKGDDGKTYKAHEVVTKETDEAGKTWEVAVRTYNDEKGNPIKDTIKTHVYTEKYGKENVEITKKKSVHKTPTKTRTVDSEESKYHYKETFEEWEGDVGKKGNKIQPKTKYCKMPEGFSAKHLAQTKAIATLNFGDDE